MFAARTCFISIGALFAVAMPASSADLQSVASRAMHGNNGSVAVIEVKSGAVIAAYNLSGAGRRVVRPGSAIKPFTLLAMLETGVVKSNETLACRRRVEIAGHKLDCSHPDSEPVNAISALAYSCNDYFTTMSARLKPRDLEQEFLRAGLASRSAFAAASTVGEVGLSNTREQLQLQAIGEQNVRTTPLELLGAYQQLALRRLNADADPAQKIVPACIIARLPCELQ